jgi:hypothetical protein
MMYKEKPLIAMHENEEGDGIRYQVWTKGYTHEE